MTGAPDAPGAGLAPGALALASDEPKTGSAPTEAAAPPAEPKESEAVAPAAGSKLVPAEHVAGIHPGPRGLYIIPQQGRRAGRLTEGMVLPVVTAPMKDKKAELLGEAMVVTVLPRRTLVKLDAHLREAGLARPLFVVLPERSVVKAEPQAPASPSEPPVETATPAPTEPVPTPVPTSAPRELHGRITSKKSLGVFGRVLLLTNTDSFTWNNCILVREGRDRYKLGGMISGLTREIPLSAFERSVRDVPYVEPNWIGLFCDEGQQLIPDRG